MCHQQQHVQGVVVVEHGAVHLEYADIQSLGLGIFPYSCIVVTDLLNVSHLLDKPVQTLGHAAHLHHAVIPV